MIITENDLDEWVRGNARVAQGVIPELVARLVAASIPQPKERRFPLGDSIGQPGPDGVLDCDRNFSSYVVSGVSYWEIGTSDDLPAKPTSDYKGLTSESGTALSVEVRAQAEFVFVTPLSARRGWTIKRQSNWIAERKRRNEWRDVRVIDGTKLIAWLSEWPSVERWLAKTMGRRVEQLDTPTAHWRVTSSIGEPPPLCPNVFLTGRDVARDKLQAVFSRTYQRLKLTTHFPDQVVDFVAAYLAGLDMDQRLELEGRCLIVKGPEAWAEAADLGQPHFLVADATLDLSDDRGTKLIQKAVQAGHAVVFWGPQGGIPDPISAPLPFPRDEYLKDALVESGYPVERARTLAQKSGGNLGTLLRCVQNLSLIPEWAQGSAASELVIAELLGGWTDASEGDRVAVEEIAGKAYGEWIETMRNVALSSGTPLTQHDGRWKFSSRYEGWYALGPSIFDAHLDRMRSTAISVLGERDPQFELPPDERYLSRVQGKTLTHSGDLRHGLAESIALLGSHPDALKSCTAGKAEATAALVIREVLRDADWVRWASVDNMLPLLAEAAPDEFLDAVDAALERQPCLFRELIAQEGKGPFGGNYLTGTLWALETLAWDPSLLSRVLLCLAELARMDPGGRWTNRPDNSMTTVLLPWLPQTCAPFAARRAAVGAVLSEQPEVGWKLLVSLLPRRHTISTYTRRPTWRETIPSDWSDGVSNSAYWEQVASYTEMLLAAAGSDPSKLAEIVAVLDDLPADARERLLAWLVSPAVRGLPEADRLSLWNQLMALVTNHRAYADAEWALPATEVDKVAAVADALAPVQPSYRHQRLFTDRAIDLYEEKGDWEAQKKALEVRRQSAVREIEASGGADAVASFASAVESPWRAGWSYGAVGLDDADAAILPQMLASDDQRILQFAGGFVIGRFFSRGREWAERVGMDGWTRVEIGQFLAFLPFGDETWRMSAALLGEDESQYWAKANVNPYQVERALEVAIDRLILYGRPNAAIDCVARMIGTQGLDRVRAIRALDAAVKSPSPANSMEVHETVEIIKALQDDPEIGLHELCRIEWAYLPLLDEHSGARPKTLESRLARDPEFFCYVIGLAFRSRKTEGSVQETDESGRRVAENGYRLLSQWQVAPGTQPDGSLVAKQLNAWIDAVKEKTTETGHVEISMTMIGHVLAHAPADPDGLWIHRAVAAVLNAREANDLRDGFVTETLNSRGVHWVDPSGKQEEELEAKYLAQADDVDRAGFPRLAAALRKLAKSYGLESRRVRSSHDLDD